MNNQPVAWIKQGKLGYPVLEFDKPFRYKSYAIQNQPIALYNHPAKTLTPLTEDECKAIIEKHNWFAKSWAEMAMEIHDAILRKAQEK